MKVSMLLGEDTKGWLLKEHYTTLTVAIEYSEFEVAQMKKRNLQSYILASGDITTASERMFEEIAQRDDNRPQEERGKICLHAGYIAGKPQTLYFRHYHEALAQMEQLKERLKILKTHLEHGTSGPVAETFEL